MDRILKLRPDAAEPYAEITGTDGIAILHRLMRLFPFPMKIVQSIAPKGYGFPLSTMDALAWDVSCQPGPAFIVAEMSTVPSKKTTIAATVKVRRQKCFLDTPSDRIVIPFYCDEAGGIIKEVLPPEERRRRRRLLQGFPVMPLARQGP